jgi:hypothetical protein
MLLAAASTLIDYTSYCFEFSTRTTAAGVATGLLASESLFGRLPVDARWYELNMKKGQCHVVWGEENRSSFRHLRAAGSVESGSTHFRADTRHAMHKGVNKPGKQYGVASEFHLAICCDLFC